MEITNLSRNAEQTVSFAGEELKRYLTRMLAGEEGVFSVFLEVSGDSGEKVDSFSISAQCSGVEITGSNPRSVLLGVYDYLHRLGCRFLAPGMEVVPRIQPGMLSAEKLPSSTGGYVSRAPTRWKTFWTLLTGCQRWDIIVSSCSFRFLIFFCPGGITMT